jgi:hypothetical protein
MFEPLLLLLTTCLSHCRPPYLGDTPLQLSSVVSLFLQHIKFLISSIGMLTVTDTEWGACSWPWHLRWGNSDPPLFATSDPRISVKNTLGWSAVVFCGCELIHSLYVVFCVVRNVHKFDFRAVTNETPNKWPFERGSCSDTHVLILMFWYPCSDTHVLILMSWYPCPDTHVLILMFWYPCPNTHVLILMFWYSCSW